MKLKIFLVGMLTVISVLLIGCNNNPDNLTAFATCLSDNGAELYGSEYCPHCTDQKEMFGEAIGEVDYTECTVEQQKCAKENVKYLPTWKFADGTQEVGVQDFATLAGKTGCKLG